MMVYLNLVAHRWRTLAWPERNDLDSEENLANGEETMQVSPPM